jgi:hypothetical protein
MLTLAPNHTVLYIHVDISPYSPHTTQTNLISDPSIRSQCVALLEAGPCAAAAEASAFDAGGMVTKGAGAGADAPPTQPALMQGADATSRAPATGGMWGAAAHGSGGSVIGPQMHGLVLSGPFRGVEKGEALLGLNTRFAADLECFVAEAAAVGRTQELNLGACMYV